MVDLSNKWCRCRMRSTLSNKNFFFGSSLVLIQFCRSISDDIVFIVMITFLCISLCSTKCENSLRTTSGLTQPRSQHRLLSASLTRPFDKSHTGDSGTCSIAINAIIGTVALITAAVRHVVAVPSRLIKRNPIPTHIPVNSVYLVVFALHFKNHSTNQHMPRAFLSISVDRSRRRML